MKRLHGAIYTAIWIVSTGCASVSNLSLLLSSSAVRSVSGHRLFAGIASADLSAPLVATVMKVNIDATGKGSKYLLAVVGNMVGLTSAEERVIQ